jgi:hypothetical protein
VIRSLFARLKPGRNALLAGVLGWVLAVTGTASAQNTLQAPKLFPGLQPAIATADSASTSTNAQTPATDNKTIIDPMVQQASCCGKSGGGGHGGYGGLFVGHALGGGGGCADGTCHAGRFPCHGFDMDTWCGRCLGGLYEELCCPDPCYEPAWIPTANAAFFQDGPRPVTQTRIRWDRGLNNNFPDTAEWFWAKIGGKGPSTNTPSLRYDQLYLYQEIAAKGASVFFEVAYRSFDPVLGPSAAGFSDMNLGAKSVLLDRELLLVTMQFRTFIPTGNFSVGLGTGHVALEPSLLAALKLTPTTHLQMQVAEWIPIGGTAGFEGSTFHFHTSLNQMLCQYGNMLAIIGTLEMNGWSFRGEFTDFPSGLAVPLSSATYMNGGPGIRMQICERVDFGFAAAFGFGNRHGPDQLYRTEFRMRY